MSESHEAAAIELVLADAATTEVRAGVDGRLHDGRLDSLVGHETIDLARRLQPVVGPSVAPHVVVLKIDGS